VNHVSGVRLILIVTERKSASVLLVVEVTSSLCQFQMMIFTHLIMIQNMF